MQLPNLADLDEASRLIYAAMQPTPQYSWPLLNEALGVDTWLKHENHTPAGAFKVRGGLVYMDRLTRREPGIKGVIAATRGNHGQSVAFGAKRHGVPATIVVPHGNSREKNAAMRGFGAALIEHGMDFQESREHAQALAERDDLHMVPSCHPDLVAGVATYWLELFRAQPGIDLVLVPIGQGSGICGAVAARAALGLRTRIIGVVSAHAPAYKFSFDAGYSIPAPVSTEIADGMACRVADPGSLGVILEHVDDVIAVTDDEVARAMRMLFTHTHNVAEGAGAAALAGALQLRDARKLAARHLGLPVSGGNVDAAMFGRILQAAT